MRRDPLTESSRFVLNCAPCGWQVDRKQIIAREQERDRKYFVRSTLTIVASDDFQHDSSNMNNQYLRMLISVGLSGWIAHVIAQPAAETVFGVDVGVYDWGCGTFEILHKRGPTLIRSVRIIDTLDSWSMLATLERYYGYHMSFVSGAGNFGSNKVVMAHH